MTGRAIADFVAAMGTLLLIVLAWLASLAVAWHGGRVAERHVVDVGRARVRAALDLQAAETVAILPLQREGSDL